MESKRRQSFLFLWNQKENWPGKTSCLSSKNSWHQRSPCSTVCAVQLNLWFMIQATYTTTVTLKTPLCNMNLLAYSPLRFTCGSTAFSLTFSNRGADVERLAGKRTLTHSILSLLSFLPTIYTFFDKLDNILSSEGQDPLPFSPSWPRFASFKWPNGIWPTTHSYTY